MNKAADDTNDQSRYHHVRFATHALAAPLWIEDQQIQSMPEASPTKWHLAHTSWFFETFVLAPAVPGYGPFRPEFKRLFNSYYDGVGPQYDRSQRGLLSRPSHDEVCAYRRHVDAQVEHLWPALDHETSALLTLGLAHEEQHQELILTDIKHAFATQALRPVYVQNEAARSLDNGDGTAASWITFRGGLVEQGHAGSGFAFDNERPRHPVFVQPFALATRLVTCGEYLAFMRDGGYARPRLWLSDGWRAVCDGQWRAPLYWHEHEGSWRMYTLGGDWPVDLAEPVCHVSHYEADAFARWAGARLPTETEWEHAAGTALVEGPGLESGRFHPSSASNSGALEQLFGVLWQWTSSAHAPYPGFRAAEGAIGEYNGKFMSGQMVLRGGSCLTPRAALRTTYRNFFPPRARWQMTGIRLCQSG